MSGRSGKQTKSGECGSATGKQNKSEGEMGATNLPRDHPSNYLVNTGLSVAEKPICLKISINSLALSASK